VRLLLAAVLALSSLCYCTDVGAFGYRWETLGKVHVHRHSVSFDVSKLSDDDYLTSKDLMGYGTYTMTFKVHPVKSGAVAAGYSFLLGSATEIDVEEQGSKPGEVEFTNWINPFNGVMCRAKFQNANKAHTFTYEWKPGYIAYHIDGVEVCKSFVYIPKLPANFVFEFYAMDDESWGGVWKKAKRRMTVTGFKFEPWEGVPLI
jgi:hypothetical protein